MVPAAAKNWFQQLPAINWFQFFGKDTTGSDHTSLWADAQRIIVNPNESYPVNGRGCWFESYLRSIGREDKVGEIQNIEGHAPESTPDVVCLLALLSLTGCNKFCRVLPDSHYIRKLT
jgi:hypothetical protein